MLGLTPSSALRKHFWQCSKDHMGRWVWNRGGQCAAYTYQLYSLTGPSSVPLNSQQI